MKPGDIIFWRDAEFGHNRFWEIHGVYYGALGQESVVEIKSLTETAAHSGASREHPTTFVPEPFLRGATIYTPHIRASVRP